VSLDLERPEPRLLVLVGSGGVGKTTLAAALAAASAQRGRDTLVMTFDPSLRLKDALGVGEEARRRETRVELAAPARLEASLLDARVTFDRLVERYAPDAAARDRILGNRFYQHLAGHLGGILEYMAVERLFEAAREERWQRVVLDTPPTRQALDFLAAPQRIVGFLDSGALRVALRPWFDERGRLRPAARLGPLGRRAERYLDELVGLGLLRDMAEFFQAFAPLFAGFRERALEVQALLRAPETLFLLVAGPGEERVADTLFFARRLLAEGYRLGPLLVNRVHPRFPPPAAQRSAGRQLEGVRLFRWLGERDHLGLAHLRSLVGESQGVLEVPLLAREPASLQAVARLGEQLAESLAALRHGA
jgi:anion-transporting  ArsA/GET3 family ATPase